MQQYIWLTCKCGKHLVLTNGARLVFGEGGYCDEPVALRCGGCGRRRFWKPMKVVDVDETVCYAISVPA